MKGGLSRWNYFYPRSFTLQMVGGFDKAKIPLLVVKPLTLKLSESIKLFDLSKKLSTRFC